MTIEDDVQTIWSNMQFKEKEIWQKRLFLMGLSDTHTLEKHGNLQVEKIEFLPESFLRKDDVFYEDLERFVEKSFGMNSDDVQQHTSHAIVEFHSIRHMSRVILGLLDDCTNNGLYLLAKILTQDSCSFEKTRPQMENVIRKSLEILQSKQCPSYLAKIQGKVSQLLGSQRNFRCQIEQLKATLKFHRDTVMKVLDGLGDMPTRTLSAMFRKLKGVHGYVPQLRPPKSRWNRDKLIHQVRMMCLEMIGELVDSDVLPLPLAKVMAIASLNYKLISGDGDLSLAGFVHVSSEIQALQKEIFKAIHILGQRTKKKKLEKLLQLLDPKSEMRKVGAKVIQNMLTEFLYECIDTETIPDSLIDALSIINEKPSRRPSSKYLVEEEVEEILNLSAAIKQILLDHIPGDKFDEDFADAYMGKLEESDDGDFFDEEDEEGLPADAMSGVHIRLNDFNEEVRSTEDLDETDSSSSEADLSSSSAGVARCFGDDECMDIEISGSKMLFPICSRKYLSLLDFDSMGRQDVRNNFIANCDSSSLCLDQNPVSESHKNSRCLYFAIQDVSDQASLYLYRLIGHMMEDFAIVEGLELSRNDISYLRGVALTTELFEDTTADSMGKHVSGVPEGTRVSDAITQATLKVMSLFPCNELEKIEKFFSS